jgi:hypothetical protein
MWNKKFEKGVSIVEVMVAAAILGMVAVIFINSSSMFMRTQQDLIKINKRDQIADLIIQDISEYVKPELHPYGEIAISQNYNNREDATIASAPREICVRGVETQPQVNDLFAIEGAEGRYRIEEIELDSTCDSSDELGAVEIGHLITTTTNIASNTEIMESDDVLLTFLAFKNVELECFTAIGGVNLIQDLSAADIFENLAFADDGTCIDPPDEILLLVDSWKTEIDTLKPSVTLANIGMSDEQLFKVTIGDVTNQTSLAKKFVQCAFAASTITEEQTETINFSFPGLGPGGTSLKVPTAIMLGTDNPILHFGFSIGANNARHYAGFEKTVDPDILNHIVDHDGEDGIPDNADDPNERELLFTVTDEGTQATYSNADFTTTNANCARIGASTCRQNYARHKYISVFLYRYVGTESVTVRPAGCSNRGGWDQCNDLPGSRITFEPNDLSLWFIYSEADEDNPDGSIDNQVGYIGFSIENLGVTSMIAIFDDSGESCLGDIVEVVNSGFFKCQGGYDYNNAHDGLVIHMAENDISQLLNLTLDVVNPAENIEGWQMLDAEADAGCFLAQTEDGSGTNRHGDDRLSGTLHNDADRNPECWKEITTPNTELAVALSASASEIVVWCNEPFDETGIGPLAVDKFTSFASEGYLQVGNEVIRYSGKNEDLSGENKCKFTSPLIRGIGNTVQVAENDDDEWVIFKDLCDGAETAPNCTDNDYNTVQAQHARLISGESEAAQQGAKLRVGRWADWVNNATGTPVDILIQQRESRVFSNYDRNRFRIGHFDRLDNIRGNNQPIDSFDVGEKYVASDTGAQQHTENPVTTVYAIPVTIVEGPDGVLDGIDDVATSNSQVSIINDSWQNNDRRNVLKDQQNTITIPRKVELDFQAAEISKDTTVSCSQ